MRRLFLFVLILPITAFPLFGENALLMPELNTDGDTNPVHTGQTIYRNTMLPQTTDFLRSEADQAAMGGRSLSVALSTGAELLYNEGRYRKTSELVDVA
ncbi:MAG: hypothetical protein KAR40_16975 [Candidatus Sabulitectum sp.]|nr:hypothetical protein [Candidatus Sabulitectum sp.]